MKDPKTVKSNEVIDIIDKFCDENKVRNTRLSIYPCCTFGHIVLGDYNLGNGDIGFCLQDEQIERWLKFALGDCDIEYGADRVTLEMEQQWSYDDIMETKDKIIEFLKWFLEVPEEVRDKAENGYRGF
jgi:hypothetical protein